MFFQWEYSSRFCVKVNLTRIHWNLCYQFFLAVVVLSWFLFMVVWNHLLTIAIKIRIEVKSIALRGSFGSLWHLVINSGRVIVLTVRSAYDLRQKFVIKTAREGLSHPDFLFVECNMIIFFVNTTLHSLSSCFEFLDIALGKSESFIVRWIKFRILQFRELERRFLARPRIIESLVPVSAGDKWLELGISLVEILLRLSWVDAIFEC